MQQTFWGSSSLVCVLLAWLTLGADWTHSGSTLPPAELMQAYYLPMHLPPMQAFRLPAAAAAHSTLLQGGLSVARSLLGIEQRPNATASPSPSPKGIGDGSISDVSAQDPPQIPPTILNASAPQRPAPAPAATSAAAGEAASQASWTGPTVKSVSEVKAGDSCVCWTADWCTCGWQSCPYQPPNSAASLSEAAQTLFGPDVLPQMQLGNDAPASRTAPPLT